MHPQDNYYRIGEKILYVTIIVNLTLFAVEFLCGIFGKSQALIADAFHAVSDALTSSVVLVGFKYASVPADPHHPYGHGKTESIAAKIVSLLLIAIGFKVIYDSSRLLILHDLHHYLHRPHQITLWIALTTIVVNEIQYRYILRYGKRIQSTSLIADAWHHRSDAFSSIVAFIGIAGAMLGLEVLDPAAGIVVGIFIIKIGFNIFHTAFDELLDSALPKEITDRIGKLTLETNGVKRITVLKARKLGLDILVDMTIEVDKNITIEEAHVITMKVRREVLKNITNTKDILIHVEPFRE